jgi:hypothetical protein
MGDLLRSPRRDGRDEGLRVGRSASPRFAVLCLSGLPPSGQTAAAWIRVNL